MSHKWVAATSLCADALHTGAPTPSLEPLCQRLHMASHMSVGNDALLLQLPQRSTTTSARVLIVAKNGMLDAFEVAPHATTADISNIGLGSSTQLHRSASCPGKVRRREEKNNAAMLPRCHTHVGTSSNTMAMRKGSCIDATDSQCNQMMPDKAYLQPMHTHPDSPENAQPRAVQRTSKSKPIHRSATPSEKRASNTEGGVPGRPTRRKVKGQRTSSIPPKRGNSGLPRTSVEAAPFENCNCGRNMAMIVCSRFVRALSSVATCAWRFPRTTSIAILGAAIYGGRLADNPSYGAPSCKATWSPLGIVRRCPPGSPL